MSNLTDKDKIKIFDYLAEHAREIKLVVNGCTDWVYIDQVVKPKRFAAIINSHIDLMSNCEDE